MSKSMHDRIKNRIKQGSQSAHSILIQPVNDESNIASKIEEPRVKFEDKYTRGTYYIENEILDTFNKITANNKGLKTKLINEALADLLKKYNIDFPGKDK